MQHTLSKLRAELKKALRTLEAALDALQPAMFQWDAPRQFEVRWVHDEEDSWHYYEFDPRIGELLEAHRACHELLKRLPRLSKAEQSEAFEFASRAIRSGFRKA